MKIFVPRPALLLLLSTAALGACVPKGRYDLAVKTAEETELARKEARDQATALDAELQRAKSDNAQKTAQLGTYEEQISRDSRRLAELEKKLTALTDTNTEVGDRLRMASKTLGELATERKSLTLAVTDAKACLDSLQATRTRPAAPPPARPATPTSELAELEACVHRALNPAPTVEAAAGAPATAAPAAR